MRISLTQLSTKIILLVFCVILFWGLALGYYIVRYQVSVLKHEMDERVTVLLNNLSFNSEYPLLIKDKEAIIRLTKGILSQRDIVFCRIEDKSGNFFYEEGTKEAGPGSEYTNSIVSKRAVEELGEDLIMGTSKELEEEIGRVYLCVSHSGLYKKLNKAKKIIAGISIFSIIATCLTIYLLLGRYLRLPIKQLVMATERISQGNLNYRVPVKTDDEIGVLAASFNKMTENLLKTTTEQTRLSAILETTTDFVGTASADGHLLYINKAGRKMIGIGEDEDVTKLTIPECHSLLTWTIIREEGIPTAIREGVWIGETALLCRDGCEITVSQVIIAHKNPDGTVEYLSTIARDITERKRFETQIVYMANLDPLTDLYNRRRFQVELENWLAQARRYEIQGALLFLDIDNFKYINDSLGHMTGDRLLKTMSSVLKERMRETDVVARLGGDEFAIILPHVNITQAEAIAKQVLELVQYHTHIECGQSFNATVSIGIAMFPAHGDTVETLLTYADLAMYRAKEEGRNRFCFYAPDQRTQIESRLIWEKRTREALRQNRFVLYLQPILDLRQDLIVRHEALLRMIDENGKLIPPSQFIDIAERFGLIHDIDCWVVHESIHLIERLRRDGRPTCIEVNLSGNSYIDMGLLSIIREEIAAVGINPVNLVFEITETSYIKNMSAARQFVTALKTMGCRFALDDFGTGFSSFNYLKHLPVDYLKIDGSFIQNLPYNSVDQHLVKAMVEVARGLGKKTIAEFVENEETVRLLRELGVDYAQGYHIGKPRHWDLDIV